jgi:ubiquinone/menaquinone biosynthesis C-methylase UbiE
MAKDKSYQLSTRAAEDYDDHKVPALFQGMTEQMLDAISLPAGGDVLDIACGTGVITRVLAGRLSEPSRLVGADINAAMIEVAKRRAPPAGPHVIEWEVAPADNMPFVDASFDLAFCQQGAQFFPDKPAALSEMRRVLRVGGRLILNCWAAVPPVFQVAADVLNRRLNAEAAKRTVEPFAWRDEEVIEQLIADAGFDLSPPQRLNVFRRMPGTLEAMRIDMLASPNEAALRALGDAAIDQIVQEVLDGVEQFRSDDMLALPQEAHLFEATAH